MKIIFNGIDGEIAIKFNPEEGEFGALEWWSVMKLSLLQRLKLSYDLSVCNAKHIGWRIDDRLRSKMFGASQSSRVNTPHWRWWSSQARFSGCLYLHEPIESVLFRL